MIRPKLLSLYRHYPAITRPISSLTTDRPLIGTTHEISSELVGLFCIPGLVGTENLMNLARKKIEMSQRIVNEIISSPYTNNPKQILYKFDRLSSEVCCIADPCNFLQSTQPASDLKNAAEEACLTVNSYVDTLNTDLALYTRLKQCVIRFSHMWTREEQRVAALLLKDFEVSGIHLEEDLRKQVLQLQSREFILGMEFFSHSLAPAQKASG